MRLLLTLALVTLPWCSAHALPSVSTCPPVKMEAEPTPDEKCALLMEIIEVMHEVLKSHEKRIEELELKLEKEGAK